MAGTLAQSLQQCLQFHTCMDAEHGTAATLPSTKYGRNWMLLPAMALKPFIRQCLHRSTLTRSPGVSPCGTEPAVKGCISMVHTLEHLTNPSEALRKVHATLSHNGIFCGIVPNFDSLCSELLLDGWAWLDPHYHYVHYTPSTLSKHLRAAGFAIRHLSTATGDYGEDIVLNYLQSVMPSLPGQLSYRDLLRAVEEDGRGEEIRFIAQKA